MMQKRQTIRILGLCVLLSALSLSSLSLLPSSSAATSEEPKRVLLLFAEDQSFPFMTSLGQSFQSTLKSQTTSRIEFYSEYLDRMRIPDTVYEKELVKFWQRKYEERKIDLIIVFVASALDLLARNRAELFPGAPVVFCVLSQEQISGMHTAPNITGVWSAPPFRSTLEMAMKLHPNTRQVMLVSGSGDFDKELLQIAKRDIGDFEKGGIKLNYLVDLTISELQQRLASLPKDTIVIHLSLSKDRAGIVSTGPEIVARLAPASNAPVYGISRTYLGSGIVGGSVLSYEDMGARAAEIGTRILAGERPQDIAPQSVPTVLMFDWREMRRWGVSENNLPLGSIVRYKEYTFWELYKWRIIGALAVIVAQALGIIWLLFTQAKRRQAEKRSARFAELAEAEHKLLDEIVANVPGIVWESRIEAGDPLARTTFVSPYLEKMLGYTQDEWVLKAPFWRSIIVDEDRELAETTLARVLETGEDGILQGRFRTKDDRVVWVESHLTAVFDEHGKPAGIRGVTMDISDRRRAEIQLQQAMEEVSQLKNKLEEENVYLQEEIKLAQNFDEIVGRSDATKYVLFKIEQVAPTDSTVLITGETGTGKELVARAIHSSSSRKERPLVRVNCAALSPTLIESELFGHEKGSFTGATARKAGRFELANGGTIFLDEIGELPLELQAKLLRVLQESEFERLGSSKTIQVDVRVIAATNRNLNLAVEQGTFREDLWYRLNVFPITVPPLRKRKEDIPGLIEHFVRIFSHKVGKQITSISPASMRLINDHEWPGNVRELANVVERAVINTDGTVLRIVDHFPGTNGEEPTQSNKTLEEIEREYISRILTSTGWRIDGPKGAAKILGLNPSTLRSRINKLGIQKLDGNTLASTV